jgi:hypothetical protein
VAVELLYWEGCPSHPAALAQLRETLAALGRGEQQVVVREIATSEQAAAERFPGSPTIRVDGTDLFPVDEPPGLNCRIYRLADGRHSPTPDPGALREALERMLGSVTTGRASPPRPRRRRGARP